ncbi:hypothetical protein MRX96_023187 [Rhipicephalus microplus]
MDSWNDRFRRPVSQARGVGGGLSWGPATQFSIEPSSGVPTPIHRARTALRHVPSVTHSNQVPRPILAARSRVVRSEAGSRTQRSSTGGRAGQKPAPATPEDTVIQKAARTLTRVNCPAPRASRGTRDRRKGERLRRALLAVLEEESRNIFIIT